MDGKSLDIAEDKKQQLKQLFPEVFSEDQIDFEKLKLALGEDSLAGAERYELSWPGKYEAFKEIQKQTTATLIPDREGSVNFDTSENIFIEGENLEVLRVLQKSYYGKIKMIYIDPPYNTGNDHFVYPDDYSERQEDYQKRAGIKDEEGFLNKQDLWKKNTKENGQFHSVWLSMMYPRLYLARNLLSEDGVIFVSIDDNEVTNLRMVLDLVFGEDRFIGQLVWKSRQNKDNRNVTNVSNDHEYILVYGKRLRGEERNLDKYSNPDNDPRGIWTSANMVGLATEDRRPNLHFDLIDPSTGINYGKPKLGWRYNPETMKQLIEEEKIIWPPSPDGRPRRKFFFSELQDEYTGFSSLIGTDIYTTTGTKEIDSLFGRRVMDFPKPSKLISALIEQGSDENSIVLDFFAGSGSTGEAVIRQNVMDGGSRKFILVQMPELTDEGSEARKAGFETISDIAKERIRKVGHEIKADISRSEQSPVLFDSEGRSFDLGFKSFKLTYSNFKTWRSDVEGKDAILDQLDAFQERLKEHNSEEKLVYELLLKSGLPITAKIETRSGTHEGEQFQYHLVEDGLMLLALNAFNSTLINAILNIAPQTVVTLDSLFGGDDAFMTNTHLQLQEAGIDFKVI